MARGVHQSGGGAKPKAAAAAFETSGGVQAERSEFRTRRDLGDPAAEATVSPAESRRLERPWSVSVAALLG